MPPRILVADPDQGFGLMLAQMLEMNREYFADYVPSGSQALRLAREKRPQLVIIDAALSDMTPPALIKLLRQESPDLRIMLIPLTGTLPPEYAELNLQGTLPKPFFAGDLGGCIAQALSGILPSAPSPEIARNFSPATPAHSQDVPVIPAARAAPPPAAQVPVEVVPPNSGLVTTSKSPSLPPRVRTMGQLPAGIERRRAPRTQTSEPPETGIYGALGTLSREISAEALIVIKAGNVIAQRSNMNESRRESLSELLEGWFKLASGMAAFVGERGGRFKQLHFEGERFHIYGFAIGDSSILVAICRSDVAFGNLRLSIKSASAEIAKYLL